MEIAVTYVPDNIDINVEVYQLIDNVLILVADDGVYNPAYGENMFVSTVVNAGTYLISVNDRYNNEFNEDTYMFCLGFMGLSEEDLDNQFVVYPNPNKGQFRLRFLNKDIDVLEVSLYNYQGKEYVRLSENLIEGVETSLNVQDFAKGIYLLKIQTNKGTITKKILVQ